MTHAETRHGARSVTKNTKPTKPRKKTNLVFFASFVTFVIFVSASAAQPLRRDLAGARVPFRAGAGGPERAPSAVTSPAQQTQPAPATLKEPQGRLEQSREATEAQQRPVFRGGTHFVRVDAYPIENGKIVEGLKPEDFEILEDGKRQTIESFDFIRFDTFTPEAERRDPRSQQEGFDLAADPRYRVFVIAVNVMSSGIYYIQDPLTQFLDRVLGGNDLFGLLTTSQSAHDLVLGQKSAIASLADFWRSSIIDRQPADDALDRCGPNGEAVKGLFTLDQTYVSLESLVQQLGSLRQERKNLIFVSNALRSPGPKPINRPTPGGGTIPKIGVSNGRIAVGDSPDMLPGTHLFCSSEIQRLTSIDFDRRFRDLLAEARRENVTVYAIAPAGLQAPVTVAGMKRVDADNDSLMTLVNETGGIAIVNTNDLSGGMQRIGDDLAAYYVLGYYTTNTKWDGNIRKIQVRDKRTGKTMRARREYRGPTAAEIAALAAPPAPRKSSPAPPLGVTAPDGPGLLGDPILTINGKRFGSLIATRADRIRIAWPLLAAVQDRQARLLDRRGQPLAVPVEVREDDSQNPPGLVLDLRLAPLSRGEYSIEVTAAAGTTRDRKLLPLKIE